MFQEEIKDYFESLGTYAETNVTLSGARGDHDIDVLVKTKFLGRDVTWVIEAKKWKYNVSKEKVLALITIIQDIGADRGFIISEKGFQKGAIKSAENTNITLTTFEDLKEETKAFIDTEILKQYEERYKLLYARYFSHPKETRKDYDLRHDFSFTAPFSGNTQLSYIGKVLDAVKERKYPIASDTGLAVTAGEKQIEDFQQACNWLNLNLNLLDRELMEAEQKMLKFNDFAPKHERWVSAIKSIKSV
ncbi:MULTISPECIES: restriction endonuclease [unclassified Vibrio]|uniref:restriction endonuclease n=1 Tax=unclassified Vibrio TaxID=2614977 RepID=UPI002553E909|nr:restriction endonuclease [Vibrio sp. D406a]MDK9778986.1 restriction endonuclease [Vibrio sp. D401a]MDK9806988.1 restriction endonuclease [Vibrio sp. D406a]